MSSAKETRAVERVFSKFSKSRELCERYHRRAHVNGSFVSPLVSSWSAEDRKAMKEMKAPVIDLPYARLLLAAFSGKEMLDRLDPRPLPFEDGDAQWAERVSLFSRWDRGNDAGRAESLAFRSALNSGVGVYRAITDVNRWVPKTQWKYYPLFDAFWDDSAEDPNFVDRTWGSVVRRMTFDEFRIWFPQYYKKVKKGSSGAPSIMEGGPGTGGMERGNRRPRVYRGGDNKQHRNKRYDVEVIYYEEKSKLPRIMIDHGTYYEVVSDAEFLAKFSNQQDGKLMIDPNVRWRPTCEDVYTYKLIANGKLLKQGPIAEKYWTINFICGFRAETRTRIEYHGVTDLNKDLAMMLNKFASMFIFKFATSAKNTWLKKPGAFNNDQAAEAKLAQGGFIDIDDFDSIQALENPGFPPMEQGMDIFKSMMYDVSGADPYSLAQVGSTGSLSRTSSKTVAQVAQSGTALVAEPFDNLGKAREESLKMQIKKMIAHVSPEKLGQIIGDRLTFSDGVEGAPEFQIPPKEQWGRLLEMDIQIDHIPSTATEKQAVFDGLVQHGGLDVIMAQMPDLLPDIFPGLPFSKQEAWKARIYQQAAAAQQSEELDSAPGGEAEAVA